MKISPKSAQITFKYTPKNCIFCIKQCCQKLHILHQTVLPFNFKRKGKERYLSHSAHKLLSLKFEEFHDIIPRCFYQVSEQPFDLEQHSELQ